MQILMLTSLFPPDTGEPAPYAKLLAKHLSTHQLEVIAYGNLPESVENVQIRSIEKRSTKLQLVFQAVKKLRTSPARLWLIHAGPSTELPALIASYFKHTPIVLLESDPRITHKVSRGFYKILRTLLHKRLAATIQIPKNAQTFLPDEWLPFSSQTMTSNNKENWWSEHIETILSYGK